MASELLKRKSLINRLKEPDVPVINFDLINSAKDYNIESIEEDILPAPKPKELFEERDRLRIESLEQSLQESKPFLMDESVDFIERKEFFQGSRGKEFADLPQEILDRLLPIEGTDIFTNTGGAKKVNLTQTGKNLLKNFETLILITIQIIYLHHLELIYLIWLELIKLQKIEAVLRHLFIITSLT